MGVLQGGYCQQDPDEEDDRAHIDPRQCVDQGQVPLFIIVLVAMNQLADRPEDSQTEQDAHERGQMRKRP